MKHKAFVVLTCIGMAGCAYQSDVMRLSEDTYQVAVTASPARGGETGAREMAMKSANEKCDSMGKQIQVKDIRTKYAFPAASAVTVTFTCK